MLHKLTVIALIILLTYLLMMLFIPKMNFRPMPEGLCTAELKDKPNWVSSLVDKGDQHYVASLGNVDLTKMAQCLKQSKLTITEESDQQLIGYRRSRYFHFTDWFCITNDGNITSSATMGHSDLGNNKAWVSKLREHCLDKA